MSGLPKRYPDWPDRLAAFVHARRRLPFVWGSNDCAIFACDGWLALTGVDLAATFRGRYDTAAGAARALRAHGCRDLAGLAVLMAGRHGIAEVAPRAAGRSAIGLLAESGPLGGLALRIGAGWASVVEDRGYATFETGAVARAWDL